MLLRYAVTKECLPYPAMPSSLKAAIAMIIMDCSYGVDDYDIRFPARQGRARGDASSTARQGHRLVRCRAGGDAGLRDRARSDASQLARHGHVGLLMKRGKARGDVGLPTRRSHGGLWER